MCWDFQSECSEVARRLQKAFYNSALAVSLQATPAALCRLEYHGGCFFCLLYIVTLLPVARSIRFTDLLALAEDIEEVAPTRVLRGRRGHYSSPKSVKLKRPLAEESASSQDSDSVSFFSVTGYYLPFDDIFVLMMIWLSSFIFIVADLL